MTRICKVKGWHNFIGGKDNDKIFEEGIIYEVRNILGTIMLTPIGKQSEVDNYGREMYTQSLEQLVMNGSYLLTQEEVNKEFE